MDDGLSENDPYRGMETGSDAIRPEWDYILNGQPYKNNRPYNPDKKKNKKKVNGENAANKLGAAEKSATNNDIGGNANGLGGVKEKESKAGGFYSGKGKDGKGAKGSKGIGKALSGLKGKGILKKGGPVGLIIGLIIGVGGLIGGSQLSLPFSLIAQFTESFNSMHTSANIRSNSFFRMQMESGRIKNPIKGKIFGADTFKITKRQASKLSQQGIEIDDNFEGSGMRVLKFDDGTGEIRIVAADDTSVSKLNSMNLKNFDTDDVKYNAEAVSFKNIYADNADFFNGYNKGSMTWRGAIANWFGTRTADFLKSNKITRNLFKNYIEKIEAANNGNTRSVATEMIANRADEIDDGGIKLTEADKTETDENGNVKTENGNVVKEEVDTAEINPSKGGGDFNNGSDTTAAKAGYSTGGADTSAPSKLSRSEMNFGKVKSKLEDISGTVQKGANIACAALNTMGAISLLVTASQALQIINLVSAYFESIDKVKAGDGDNSPIHELSGALSERKNNEHTEIALNSDVAWNDNDQESNFVDGGSGGIKTIKTVNDDSTTTGGSAMESSGIISLYGGGRVDPNDPSVKSFNFTSSINSILGGIGVSMTAFETCAIAKIAANVTSAISDAITVAGCILGVVGAAFTFGVSAGACGPFVGKTLVGIALGVTIGMVVSGIVSTVVPAVASMMTRDLITDIGGEDLGNALTSGANMYMGNNHRSNGGSLATKEKYIAFASAQSQVIAENAKYERWSRSPFDVTSKYTFMGTLMTQLVSFINANSLTGIIASGGSVLSNSVIALSPTASAYDIAENLPDDEEYEVTCPYLASIGAVGDAYCNPYSITDMSTIQMDPLEVIDEIGDNFQDNETSDGNVVIDGESDLAKYIIYCDGRESSFGVADQNIVSGLTEWTSIRTGNSGLDTATNSAIGAVPILGDVIDVMSDQTSLDNLGYISGESCVAGNNVDNASAPGWDRAQYYQRFIEDQSLAESIGLIDESAVTAFVREYREDHPLDNSYEGILARYSGLSKDDVIAFLEIVDYVNYIANYDPTERYAFGEPAVEVEEELKFDNDNEVAGNWWAILANQISYADVRNRSFAV